MDDVELRSVQLQFPHSRGSIEGSCDIRRVPTDKGDLTVAVQGDTRKPAILTYHDLGLNCEFSTEENNQFIYIIHAFFLPPSFHQTLQALPDSSTIPRCETCWTTSAFIT